MTAPAAQAQAILAFVSMPRTGRRVTTLQRRRRRALEARVLVL